MLIYRNIWGDANISEHLGWCQYLGTCGVMLIYRNIWGDANISERLPEPWILPFLLLMAVVYLLTYLSEFLYRFVGQHSYSHKQVPLIQVRSKVFISQNTTNIIDVYFKVTTCFGLYYQAIVRSQETEIWGSYTL